MRRLAVWTVIVGLALWVTTAVAAGPTVRVSVAAGQPNADSRFPDISGNGRYITFSSDANNLVAGDINGVSDIFVYDRETQVTERVSLRTDRGEANGASYAPAISDDGNIVVFQSFATNLVDGDTNNVADVFIHERSSNITVAATYVIGGFANDISYTPDVSANGRYVTFWSYASNLVGDDSNGTADIFRFDRLALVMQRVSLDSNEVQANGESRYPSISGDGNRIVFESEASNLVAGDGNTYSDIFLRDIAAGTTTRLSVHSNGTEGNGGSSEPTIADNGQYVVYASLANNLVSGDSNNYQDIFLRNIGGNSTERVSLASNGTQPDASSYQPDVSADGRYVAFRSAAGNLVSGDWLVADDVFVRDRTMNTLTRASINGAGEIGNGNSGEPMLTANGRYVVFSSQASNLVSGDTNGRRDIFLHDRKSPPGLTIDYTTGQPGSHFIVRGTGFAESQTVIVTANGKFAGTLNSDANGDFIVRLITTPSAKQGFYAIGFEQGDLLLYTQFTLKDSYPLRSGAGGGITIPNNAGLDKQIYLPVAAKS